LLFTGSAGTNDTPRVRTTATALTYNASTGDFATGGNVTAYSDERLKKDWQELPDDFIEKLASVKSGTFTRVDTGVRQVGVGAGSFKSVLEEAVSSDDEGWLRVSYGNAALAACIKLAQRVLSLEEKLKAKE
jgi:hypothetical protein